MKCKPEGCMTWETRLQHSQAFFALAVFGFFCFFFKGHKTISHMSLLHKLSSIHATYSYQRCYEMMTIKW